MEVSKAGFVGRKADIQWSEKGLPVSIRFDDKYFCDESGLEESKYIFCGGNDLRRRWLNLDVRQEEFVVAETGFGTGLNFLTAWQLWRECQPRFKGFHYISVEQFPLSVDQLTQSLNLWPSLSEQSQQLIKSYPTPKQQIHQLHFFEDKIKLTLVFDHVNLGLELIKEQVLGSQFVDAWFLDGFAPPKNPEMWSVEVFKQMSQLSQSGTTFSTFTVAGSVRRGLALVGFDLDKVQGFGRKRQMLQGTFQ